MKVRELREWLQGVSDELDVVICLSCETVDGDTDYEAEGLLTKARVAQSDCVQVGRPIFLLEGVDIEHRESPINSEDTFRQHIKVVKTDV